MLETAKGWERCDTDEGGDSTHSPATSETSCGRGFFLVFPYRLDFSLRVSSSSPPAPPIPSKKPVTTRRDAGVT